MNDEILKLAMKCFAPDGYWQATNEHIESFYRAAFNAALEQAAIAVMEIDDVDRYDLAAAIQRMKK